MLSRIILNHNTETVPRLYPTIRLGGDYQITLDLLLNAKTWYPGSITKSGIMLVAGRRGSRTRGNDPLSCFGGVIF